MVNEGKDRHGKVRKIKKHVLNDGKKKKSGQGSHAVQLIDTPEYQAKVEKVYTLLKEGLRSNEVYAMMCMEEPDLSEARFVDMIKAAYQFSEVVLHKDREYVFQLHMDRYEKLYNDSSNMVNMWGQPLDPVKDWHIMTIKYQQMIQALQSKERLVGLHDKAITLEFNETSVTAKMPQETRGGVLLGGIDLTRLTLDEKKELLALIQESRTNNLDGIQKVVIKKTVIEINPHEGKITDRNTLDIAFQDMPADVVSKMQRPEKPEDEPNIDTSPDVIDEVGDKKGVGLREIEEKMKTNLLSEFKKALQEKKGIKKK